MKIHTVEQGSPDWFSLRCGKPTASNFSRLVDSKGKPSKSLAGYANELAGELFAGRTLDQFEGNAWMNRGKEMEAEAIKLYAFTTAADVQRVGFVTADDDAAGCSPDALVDADGGLETKCLKAEHHIAAMTYYQKHGKAPTSYVQQVQGGMLICQRTWWDLMFFHPDMPPLIIRHEPCVILRPALLAGIAEVCRVRDDALATLRHEQQYIPEKSRNPMEAG